jgi:hypothetical protein
MHDNDGGTLLEMMKNMQGVGHFVAAGIFLHSYLSFLQHWRQLAAEKRPMPAVNAALTKEDRDRECRRVEADRQRLLAEWWATFRGVWASLQRVPNTCKPAQFPYWSNSTGVRNLIFAVE